jgi:PAS domain S-box-containing protein
MNDTKNLGLLSGVEAQHAVETEQRASILLVDDQPARLLTYEAMLSGLGLRCVRALSGVEALEKLLVNEFAVIVLDVNMPEMDGFEVARIVRGHPRMERIPIIFVTGVNVSELDRMKGYEVGAIDYISVPVVPEILRSKVALLVELHERRTELKVLNRALVDARKRIDEEHASVLAHKEAQLRAAFEHPEQVTMVLEAERDENGVIKDWTYRDANTRALQFLGMTRERLLGRTLSDVLPQRSERSVPICTRVHETQEAYRYETHLDGADLLVTVYPGARDQVISSALDITERKRAEAALRESERRKDEFLAMLAHELRNPVAPIRNAAEVLARLVQEEQPRSLIAMIQRQSVHLTRILDDLLDVARITQGRIELRRESVSVTRCIDLALEGVHAQLQTKRHRLTIERDPELLHVNADTVRLEQCVTNLLMNAVKYTDDGGEIRIRTRAVGNNVLIEVTDSGVGIAADFLPHVFELFTQSERSLDRSQGGLGVGLAICKQLIEMHGGTVSCHSAGLGYGATFTICLPRWYPSVTPSSVASCATRALGRVLIVDDNRDAADSLAMCLQLEGYEVLAVYSSEAALAQCATYMPQIVLLDIGLPFMDGYEIARRLRAAFGSLRIIALTGYGNDEDKRRTTDAGFDAHLTKPVDLSALKAAFATTKKMRT